MIEQPIDSAVVDTLWLKMYSDFVEAFDGIDNGITQYVSSEPALYRSRTDISSRIGSLNPRWNEDSNDQILDDRFTQASQLAGKEFLERLDYLHKAWLPAREIVKRAVEKRKDVHPSGKVLVFDEFAPWKVNTHLVFRREPDLVLTSFCVYSVGTPSHPRTRPRDSCRRAPPVRAVPRRLFEARDVQIPHPSRVGHSRIV